MKVWTLAWREYILEKLARAFSNRCRMPVWHASMSPFTCHSPRTTVGVQAE